MICFINIPHSQEILVLTGLVILSAFFSGSETALFLLTPAELIKFNNKGSFSSRLVCRILGNPNKLLNTLLLGNMIVNVAFSTIAAVLLISLQDEGVLSGPAVAASSFIPLAAIIFLGEVTPKMIAYSMPQKWSLFCAAIVLVLQYLLSPLVWLFESLLVRPATRLVLPTPPKQQHIQPEELAAMMDISLQKGVVDQDTGGMLREIMTLGDIQACDIMIPRVDVIQYDINDSPEGLAAVFRKTRLRKIPVFDDRRDNILGLIHARELLLCQGPVDLRKLIRPIAFMPENATLDKVLENFRRAGGQVAMVVDEYGGVAGLITIEDVMEEIVGDIPDRHETTETHIRKLSDSEYIISGDLPVHDWPDAFELEEFDSRVSTLGGLVVSLMGKVPLADEQVTCSNLRFTVEKVNRGRVRLVRVEVIDTAPLQMEVTHAV